MKKILISPKIIKDKYGQFGQFLDLSWLNFFHNKVNLFTWIPQNKNSINSLNFDGVILTGGNDLYSIKKKKENLIRDKFELKLLKFAIKKSIPILAVCRGFQFINNFFGGSLMSIISTSIPDKHNFSTVASPIPPDAPVTTAVFPLKFNFIWLIDIYPKILKIIIDLKKIYI